MNEGLTIAGAGLITLAVTPTPDDVTVISPILQLIGGASLILLGLMTNKK